MARPFSTIEASRIIEEHNTVLHKLENAEKSEERYRKAIDKASEDLVAKEVLTVLRDVPIEEINRDKRGFRIKALKEHGYNTIADIAPAVRARRL